LEKGRGLSKQRVNDTRLKKDPKSGHRVKNSQKIGRPSESGHQTAKLRVKEEFKGGSNIK